MNAIMFVSLLTPCFIHAAEKPPPSDDAALIAWFEEIWPKAGILARTMLPFISDVDVRLAQARVLLVIGEFIEIANPGATGSLAFNSAANAAHRLLEDYPNNPAVRQQFAVCLRRFAGRFKPEKPILDTLKRGLEVIDGLCQDFPEKPEYLHEKVLLLNTLADKEWARGESAKSQLACEIAIDVSKALVDRYPEEPKYLLSYSYALTGRTVCMDPTTRGDEILKIHHEALKLREKLVQAYASNPEFRILAAGSKCNIANTLLDGLKKPEEALAWYGKAADILEKAPLQKPYEVKVRDYLINTYWGRYVTLLRLRKLSEAGADWQRVLGHAKGARLLDLRVSKAFNLASEEYHQEALKEAEELIETASKDAGLTYLLARTFALVGTHLAGKDEKTSPVAAERAMRLLASAKELNAFADEKICQELRTDNSFDVLRARNDFMALLRQLPNAAPK
jgi:tetratricopeptide (TPR) repeat protein